VEGEGLSALRKGITTLEATLGDSQRRTEDLDARLAALSLRAELATRMEGQLAIAREEISRLVQRLTVLETGANQYTALTTMEHRLSGLESEFSAAQAPREALADVTTRLNGLESEVGVAQALRDALSGIATRLDGMDTVQQGLQGQYATLAETDNRLDGSLERQGSGLEGIGARVLALETDNAREGDELRQTLVTLREEIELLRQGLHGLNGEEAGIHQKLAEMTGQFGEFQAQADLMAGQVAVLEERTGRLEILDVLEMGASRVDERLDEQAATLAALPVRLEALERSTTGLTERLEVLDALEVGAIRIDEQLDEQAVALAALPVRLEALEQSATGLTGRLEILDVLEVGASRIDEQLDEQAATLAALPVRLEALEQSTAGLAERLEVLDALEVGASRIDEQLDEQAAALAALPVRLETLEQSAAGLAGRLTDTVQQLRDRASDVRTISERLATLTDALERNGLDLTDLTTRTDELQQISEGLAQGLPQALEQVETLRQRDAELEQSLGTTREQVGGLATALETFTSAAATTSKRERQVRERDVGTVRSGLRMVGWSGVVVTLVVIALTIGGYLLSDQKQDTQWQALQGQMQRLDQRIVAAAGGTGSQGVERLQGVLEDLRMQVKTLGKRLPEEIPGGESTRLADIDTMTHDAQQQNNLVQALDDLGRRVAGLEDRIGHLAGRILVTVPPPRISTGSRESHAQRPRAASLSKTPVSASEKASPPTALASKPSPQPTSLPKPAKSATAPSVSTPTESMPTLAQWREAQEKGRFTLQVLAARRRDDLENFARRRDLGGKVTWLAPTRSGGWYIVLYGIYPDHASALQDLRGLAGRLPGIKPWVRQIPKEGEIQVLP